MSDWKLDRLERHPAGFWLGWVRVGEEEVRIDNALGSWTMTADPSSPPEAKNVARRELIHDLSVAAQALLRVHQDADGEAGDKRIKRSR